MSALLDQLELNKSFFIELSIFAVLFFILSKCFFQPFLKLLQNRYQRTIEDKDAAEKMMAQANAKLDEYQRLITEGRLAAKKEYNLALVEARKQESEILMHARAEAKRMTKEATDSIHQQQEQIKKQLEKDIEWIARSISDKLLSRKV